MAIQIRVNERLVDVEAGMTLADVRDAFKPDADIVIYNGFPARDDEPVAEGDEIVLIRRGEVPDSAELKALLVSRHTPGVHAKIDEARIGVAGLGGLGSQVAIALARLGVGALVLADFDIVEPSNLNRQQYFIDQLGMPKVDALAGTLRRINPYVKLERHPVVLTPDNIPKIFADCDLLIEAFDRADQKAMLISTALDHLPKTRIIAASGLAGYGRSDELQTHRLSDRLFVVGDLETEARPGVGLMAPRVGVAAHMQANLALRLLLGLDGEPES